MNQTIVHVYKIKAEDQENATLVLSPAEPVQPSVKISDGTTEVHVTGLSQSQLQESICKYISMLKYFPKKNQATKEWLKELHAVLCDTIEALNDNND